jgi:hypothetical protein
MARFYASLTGTSGTPITRCGSKNSGLSAFIHGWRSGVSIKARHEEGTGDIFDLFVDSGSNPSGARAYLGSIRLNSDGAPTFYPTGIGSPIEVKS